MDEKVKKISKVLLGVLLGVFALYLGKTFWVYSPFYFETIIGPFAFLVWLIYIYIAVELARFKKWASTIFLTILILAAFLQILYVLVVNPQAVFLEGLCNSIFWVSLVAIPVFGISALVRRIRKK